MSRGQIAKILISRRRRIIPSRLRLNRHLFRKRKRNLITLLTRSSQPLLPSHILIRVILRFQRLNHKNLRIIRTNNAQTTRNIHAITVRTILIHNTTRTLFRTTMYSIGYNMLIKHDDLDTSSHTIHTHNRLRLRHTVNRPKVNLFKSLSISSTRKSPRLISTIRLIISILPRTLKRLGISTIRRSLDSITRRTLLLMSGPPVRRTSHWLIVNPRHASNQ